MPKIFLITSLPYPSQLGGDNGGPDKDLPNFVKAWNARYESPQLVISTHEHLFTEFEVKYGNLIPKLEGEMTPFWEDGAFSTVQETMLVRKAADRLIQAEALYSLYHPESYSNEAFYKAWQQVILWDEHTWGAWNCVSDLDLSFVKEQWQIKQCFAIQSDKLSKELINHLMHGDELSYDSKAVVLFNTSSQPCGEVVLLPNGFIPQSRNVLCQTVEDGYVAVMVVFDKGWQQKVLIVNHEMRQEQPKIEASSSILENEQMRICFDENNGTITSLWHKVQKKEYVAQEKHLLELIYLSGKYQQESSVITDVCIPKTAKGQLFDQLEFTGKLKGCNNVQISLKLNHYLDRLDIDLIIDKQAIRKKESLHFAFPIGLDEGVLRYDCAGKPIEPEIDQLPGSCKNFFSPTSYVDVSDEECGITVSLPDVPLIEIGDITAEIPWKESIEPSTTFYSYVLNNYWHTNYKTNKSGVMTFRYSILLHGKLNEGELHCFAQSQR
ncbi:MAG TPA: glycoside hydrolase family 38 C-terminal domain-containing protein [Candidatus Cloacimonadota bacterium]|nr:glycoside hydrolase family 38 C-terminal domain-containing protein [Candidatus Cloacimonadota bacterium]